MYNPVAAARRVIFPVLHQQVSPIRPGTILHRDNNNIIYLKYIFKAYTSYYYYNTYCTYPAATLFFPSSHKNAHCTSEII